MAEVLGIVASGIAVAQVAGELVATSQKLYTFWIGIKGAPKQVADALKEIVFLGKIIEGLQNENGVDEGRNEVVREALVYCFEVMGEFEGILRDLGTTMGANGAGRRHWGALKVLLKSQILSDFERRLERAKSMLGLAVDSYSISMHRQQVSMLTTLMRSQIALKDHGETTEIQVNGGLPEIIPSNTDLMEKSTSTTRVTTRWYGLGWMQTMSRTSKIHDIQSEIDSIDEVVEVNWKFIPASWLRSKGFTLTQRNKFGQWQYCFTTVRVVPDSSPIFEACRTGDVDEVIRLVRDGKATVFDVSEKGWSLLHVAAAHLRPELCRWLILHGVRGDSVDVEWGRTPLHIAANQSGRDLGWNRYGSFMKAIDNVRRPSDAQDTIRILVEEGQCDPMSKTPANTPEILYGSQTALHLHTGSVDAFKYLMHQNHFMIDLTAQNDVGMTPAMDQLFAGWPNSSELAQLSIQNNPQNLTTQRHKALFNMTNLHIAVDRLRFHEIKMSLGPKKAREMIGHTITVLLQCGADVHAVDNYGRTPLQYLCQRGYQGQIGRRSGADDSKQDICTRLSLWLELLKKANYDLREYIQKEFSLDTMEMAFEHAPEIYLQTYGEPEILRSLRTLKLEKESVTDDVVFRVKDTVIEEARDGDDGDFEPVIPGAWNSNLDSRNSERDSRADEQVDISILIKSLAEGIQEVVLQ